MSNLRQDKQEFYLSAAERAWSTLLSLITDDEDARVKCLEPCGGDGYLLLQRKLAAINVAIAALRYTEDTEEEVLDSLAFCSC